VPPMLADPALPTQAPFRNEFTCASLLRCDLRWTNAERRSMPVAGPGGSGGDGLDVRFAAAGGLGDSSRGAGATSLAGGRCRTFLRVETCARASAAASVHSPDEEVVALHRLGAALGQLPKCSRLCSIVCGTSASACRTKSCDEELWHHRQLAAVWRAPRASWWTIRLWSSAPGAGAGCTGAPIYLLVPLQGTQVPLCTGVCTLITFLRCVILIQRA